ncbi:I78 family peptidase inhibitor [Phaeobacter inhibens]|uniref:I78 family peptidase inhibitor n=1 Tax=Phaeobacter inhibens TaxID=221822 RepID=UPI0021A26580|nr:I78 family peptidase inhibitor [Phaeobacter inhibens]UWR47028.1 hypothetical protein K4F86_18550 [Phaeobacter inhibens]UWR90484.1 hypothetical protein K4L01_18070 [Phaeobacter inhibens]
MTISHTPFGLGIVGLAALFGLNACAPAEETCNRAGYTGLLGASLAAITVPNDANLRVIMMGEIVTMDFDPRRANLHIDADGRVADITCG